MGGGGTGGPVTAGKRNVCVCVCVDCGGSYEQDESVWRVPSPRCRGCTQRRRYERDTGVLPCACWPGYVCPECRRESEEEEQR